MGCRVPLIVWSTCAAALVWSGACLASEPSDALPEMLRTCASMKRNTERLACYDRAVEQLSSTSADSGTEFKPSPEALFGATAKDARPTPSSSATERQELAAVTARISTLKTDGEGMHVIELDNGQTWRQISGPRTLLLNTGDEIMITRAALNSFRLSTPSGRIAKVRRVR